MHTMQAIVFISCPMLPAQRYISLLVLYKRSQTKAGLTNHAIPQTPSLSPPCPCSSENTISQLETYTADAFILHQQPEASCQLLSLSTVCFKVCARLGLTSLAYMWHQPQASLLTNMVEEGVHAVLCKVAAMGLKPKQHLGKSLAEMQPFLHSLRRYHN